MKNKAFFFFSLEKPHTITPTDPVFVTVPSALERLGDFSQSINSNGVAPVVLDPLTGQQFRDPARATASNPQGLNIIPLNRINKSGQALLNYYPLPNANGRTAAGAAFDYVNQQSVDVPKHSYVIRFDIKPSEKDSVYVKAQWWTSDNEGLGTSGWPNGSNGVDRWGISSHYLYTDDGRSANWIHLLRSSVVNEFSFGWRTDTEGFVPSTGFAEGLQRSALNYTALPTGFGQIGNLPRNAVRMPATFNTDLAFFKNIRVGEQRGVQLRWEMYNIFNRANFRDIDGAMTFGLVQVNPSPGTACSATNICTAVVKQTRTSFGTVTSARAPRVMQGSIRINF